jgi:lysozyme family protein
MSFDAAFAALMGNEGKYSNDPRDPGGETMWGVTARVARRYGYMGPMVDLPLDVAKAIAKAEYWDPYLCDQFDPRIAFQVFDAAYNGGHPVKWLQQALGVTADGIIGAQTIKAARSADPALVVGRFSASRLLYLTDLPTWPTFGRGWTRRIANNLLLGAL